MLIMIRLYLQVRILMFLHTCFYFTTIVQLVTGKNLSLTMFFFWFSFILVSLLEFKSDFCDVKLKNVLLDAVVFSLIFVGSALWYFKVLQSKLQSLTGEIYALLSKLHSALEAEMALTQAQEGAWVNTLFKTISGLVLVIGVCLFAYWFFRGGGDDGGGGGGTPTEPSTSQGTPVDTTALDFSGLDKAVFDVIKSSVVGTTIFSNNSSHFSEGRKRWEDLFYSVDNLRTLLEDDQLGIWITSENVNVDALNDLTDALSELQEPFKNGTSIPDALESINSAKLAELATNLAELLPESLSNTLSEQDCPLLCSAVLLYIFTYGTELLFTIKESLECFMDQINNYRKTCPTDETEALDKCNKLYGPLKDIFDSWAKKKVNNHILSEIFTKRLFP